MTDEKGKIKRPYNYILPGYELPFLLHSSAVLSFVLTNNGKNVYDKKVYFLCFRLSKKHF